MIGRVVATKMKNTVTVVVETRKTHPLYKKTFLRTKKYLVDDQMGVTEGDIVEIVKIAPVSKRKHFKVTRVLGKDIVAVASKDIAAVTEEAIQEVLPEEQSESAAVEPEHTETMESEVKTDKTPKKKKGSKK